MRRHLVQQKQIRQAYPAFREIITNNFQGSLHLIRTTLASPHWQNIVTSIFGFMQGPNFNKTSNRISENQVMNCFPLNDRNFLTSQNEKPTFKLKSRVRGCRRGILLFFYSHFCLFLFQIVIESETRSVANNPERKIKEGWKSIKKVK